MKYAYQSPTSLLSDYVRTVLVVDVLANDPNPQLPLVITGMPAVFVQVCSNLHEETRKVKVTLFGAAVPAGFVFDPDCNLAIGYFFNPFVVPCLFDLPAKLVAKGPLDLHAWNIQQANKLTKAIQPFKEPAPIKELMDKFIEERLNLTRHLCDAISITTDRMMLDSGTEMLSTLPDAVHMTLRSFQRMFKKYVGVTANEFRRICQFQQSFQQVRSRQFERLSDVAADNGFSDQSHFVRSFREFTKTTPGKYLDEGLGHS